MKIILLVLGAILLIVLLVAHRALSSVFLIITATPYERDLGEKAVGKLLVAGDSTAYGTGVQNPTSSIGGRIAQDFPHYTIENTSKNGATTEELYALLEAKLSTKRYSAILLQIGANDILRGRSIEAISYDLSRLITLSQQHADHVFVMTAGNVGAARAFTKDGKPRADIEARTRAVRDLFLKSTQETNVTYIDLFDEPENDVFLLEPKKYFALDGLHPNKEGYAVWYTKLKPVLLEKLTTDEPS